MTCIFTSSNGTERHSLQLVMYCAYRHNLNFMRNLLRPFLEGSLKTLGLLNYHPIAELMAQPVITLDEINRVSTVHQILSTKTHNGFPVVGKNGHLRGFILRKTLCNIIKLKAFSSPINGSGVRRFVIHSLSLFRHTQLNSMIRHKVEVE